MPKQLLNYFWVFIHFKKHIWKCMAKSVKAYMKFQIISFLKSFKNLFCAGISSNRSVVVGKNKGVSWCQISCNIFIIFLSWNLLFSPILKRLHNNICNWSRTLQVVFVVPMMVVRLLTLPLLSNFGSCLIACSIFNVLFSKSTFPQVIARASPIRSPENIKQIQSGLIKFASSLFNTSKNLILTSGGKALYFSFLLCTLSLL